MSNVRIVFPCPKCSELILHTDRRLLTEDGWVHQECPHEHE